MEPAKTWPSFWRSPKHLLFPRLSRKFGGFGGGAGGAQGSSECAHHRLVLACVFLAPGDPVKSDTTVPSSRPCSAPVT